MGCEASIMKEDLTVVSNSIEKMNAELNSLRGLLLVKTQPKEEVVEEKVHVVEEVEPVQVVEEKEEEEVVEEEDVGEILNSIRSRLERIETMKAKPYNFLW